MADACHAAAPSGLFFAGTAVTITDQMKAAFYGTMLDEDRFPNVEVVTFIRDGKPNRQVYAKINADNRYDEGQIVGREVERIQVLAGRDEDHTKGGIAKPVRGDKITRPGHTPGDPVWAYTGEITGTTHHSHQLSFERMVPSLIGKRGIE